MNPQAQYQLKIQKQSLTKAIVLTFYKISLITLHFFKYYSFITATLLGLCVIIFLACVFTDVSFSTFLFLLLTTGFMVGVYFVIWLLVEPLAWAEVSEIKGYYTDKPTHANKNKQTLYDVSDIYLANLSVKSVKSATKNPVAPCSAHDFF